jgi:NhaA family Na+:H+ antiporter
MRRPREAAGGRKRGLFQRFFHSEASGSVLVPVAAAQGVLALLYLATRLSVRRFGTFLRLAGGLWAAMLASSVHVTVAGILVALTVPGRSGIEPGAFLAALRGRLDRLERGNSHPGEHGAGARPDEGHRGDRAGRRRGAAIEPAVSRVGPARPGSKTFLGRATRAAASRMSDYVYCAVSHP